MGALKTAGALLVALAAGGRLDEAITHVRKALEIKPDYADARRNLEVLRAKR